jgi:hypothetical protein
MRDYDYPGPNGYTDFEYRYGNARYLSDERIAKLPPDQRDEYIRWRERFRSWQRRNRVESEFTSVQGSRG